MQKDNRFFRCTDYFGALIFAQDSYLSIYDVIRIRQQNQCIIAFIRLISHNKLRTQISEKWIR